VGYVLRRTGAAGGTRYTAMYRDIKGRLRSAGTFGTERLASRAWQRAEADLAAGKIGDPKRGRQTLRRYVEDRWFSHHLIEATTRENYASLLDRYVLPELGPLPLVEILPGHVREWVTTLHAEYARGTAETSRLSASSPSLPPRLARKAPRSAPEV
jgi:hypothetical protein